MKNLVLTALVLSLVTTAAQADPMYALSFTTSGSNWYMWVQEAAGSTTNSGLHSFGIDVYGTGGTAVLTAKNDAPVGDVTVDPGTGDLTHNPSGFWVQKGNGVISGGNAIGISAGQNVAYTGGNDPFKDSLVIQGFGQHAGSAAGCTWAFPALLANGTFSGPGTFSFAGSGGVLNSPWVGPGNVNGYAFVPEPATMSLLGLAGLALLRRGRAM